MSAIDLIDSNDESLQEDADNIDGEFSNFEIFEDIEIPNLETDEEDDEIGLQEVAPTTVEMCVAKSGLIWSTMSLPQSQTRAMQIVREKQCITSHTLQEISSPIDAFKTVVPPVIVTIIVRETNRKANAFCSANPSKSIRKWVNTDEKELYALFCMLIFAGACKSWDEPLTELFDKRNRAIFRATMTQVRCEQLLRFMRFDNFQTRSKRFRTDKMAPFRDIWNIFLDQLRIAYKPSAFLTVDEQLVATRGRSKFRQYIPSKPGKYGIKIFWLCDLQNSYPNWNLRTDKRRTFLRKLGEELVHPQIMERIGRGKYGPTAQAIKNMGYSILEVQVPVDGKLKRARCAVCPRLKDNKKMQNGSSRGPREDTLPNAVIQEDDVRWTPLHEAAAIGDEKRLQTLLAANADRTAKESKHGNTPLHEAAWRGYSRCVKVLCAPPNPKKDQKDKKLKGVLQETRGALHSALLGIRNDGGFSALHLAAQNGHNQSCREILLAGGDPDIQNNYGDTALHTACRYGHAGATRILLSASCDSNKANLNGDTPLHIACAMGRRKLTRILLEAGSNMTVRNSQEETPRDIAIRKNYSEILSILDNPKKGRREKDKSSGSGGGRNSGSRKRNSKDNVDGVANPISWSPYGCHYFPDPSSFPSPKLDTLPKEPLKKGEQYYLDLAGNICKGPVGVGNTCYCGPFFRHIEDKINRNRKSLRKYVFKATERLDSKVQALAIRTDDQIEQLTRSMIADRIRCESRRLHLEHWLKRGEPHRLTTAGHQSRPRKKSTTMSRCKSLELLDDESLHGSKLQNSRSFDALEEAVVTVHREAEVSDDDDLSVVSLGRTEVGEKQWDRLETDYFNVSERLEELLAKTNEILEMEKEASKRRKEELLAFTEPTFKRRERRSQNVATMGKDVIEQLQKVTLEEKPPEDPNQITVVPLPEEISNQEQETACGVSEATNDYVTYLSRMQSGRTSRGPSNSSNRPLQEKYQSFSQIHSNENMLQDVITAIRKDHQMVKELIESETLNEMENTHEDKLSYKDEQTLLNVNGFFQNTCFDDGIGDSPSNTLKAENKVTMTSVKNISELCEKPFEIPTYAELNKLKPRVEPPPSQSKDWRRKAIKNSNKELEDFSERVNGTIKKVEIKNSEIKTLKKPSTGGILKRSKVQELVARLQGKLSSSVTVKSAEHDESSESSEDEHNDQNEAQQLENNQMHSGAYTSYRQPQMNSPNNSGVVPANNMVQTSSSTSLYSTPIPNNSYPYRLIPKDAYFHELPNKSRPALQPYCYSNHSDMHMQQQPVSLPNNYYHHQHQQQHHQNLQNQQHQQPQWSRMPSERMIPVSLHQQHGPPLVNPSYAPPYNNMPPLMVHTPPQPLRTPVSERLLSNRKFMPPNSSSPDYELAATPVNLKNCNQLQNANLLLQQSTAAGIMTTMDHQQHMVERDVSNDSGFSTRIYGGGSESHRPSPSLSGHTDYGGMQSPSNGLMYTGGHVQTDAGDVTYYMGNVSSLV